MLQKELRPGGGSYNYAYINSEWEDLLTSFNGNAITYDGIGNPEIYYNGFVFDWTGRQLTGATNGNSTYSFTYNDEGIRTSKTKNGITTTYYLNGTQIIGEETNGNIILYLYDESGAPIGMQYHGADYAEDVWDIYWYEKNIFGDVVAVYNAEGTKLISYAYEAYGYTYETFHNGGGNTTAKNNPFRYRSYYFDLDLKFYYLGTRYYDQETCRFISPDSVSYLGANGDLVSYNLYVYCSNNFVMYIDASGYKSKSVMEIYNVVESKPGRTFEFYGALYDNDRFHDDGPWHEQGLLLSINGPSWDIDSNTLGIGSISFDFYTGGWEWEYVDLSLFDFGHAEVAFEIKDATLNATAFASLWSPSISFFIGDVEIGVGLEIIAIGVVFKIGAEGFSAKCAKGFGGSIFVKIH